MTDGHVLQGSEARDLFKRLHKQQAPSDFYALDVDLELVSKGGTAACAPAPEVIARIDFKRPDDSLEFSEVLAYNRMLMQGIPVFIVECAAADFVGKRPANHRFTVHRYCGGDFADPVNTVTKTVGVGLSWGQLVEWERCLRANGPGTFRRKYGHRALGVDDPGSITAWGDS